MSDDSDTKDLLSLYQAPPLPPAFQEQLLRQAPLPAPKLPSKIAWWIAGAIAAAAAISLIAILRPALSPSSITPFAADHPQNTTSAHAHDDPSAPPPPPPAPAPPSGTGGALSDSERIARASLIVRATLDNINDDTATYTITRVIHGNTDLHTITEEVPGPKHWLTPQLGREVILYLRERPGPGTPYMVLSARYASPERPLDQTEKQILDLLRSAALTDSMPRNARANQNNAPGSPRNASLGVLPIEASMSDASLILRLRVDGWNDQGVQYTVLRVIYGTYDKPTILLDPFDNSPRVRISSLGSARRKFTEVNGREPDPDETLAFALRERLIDKGRERLVMLAPLPNSPDGNPVFRLTLAGMDRDPDTIPDMERRIVDILREGTHLAPLGDSRQQKVQAAGAIVRVRLEKLDDQSATWTILKWIKGDPKDASTLQTPHTLFKGRAEALVGYAATTDPALNDPAARTARIDAETKTLLQKELTPRREAILFLDNPQPAANALHATPTSCLYDNHPRITLNAFEQSLNRPPTPNSAL